MEEDEARKIEVDCCSEEAGGYGEADEIPIKQMGRRWKLVGDGDGRDHGVDIVLTLGTS